MVKLVAEKAATSTDPETRQAGLLITLAYFFLLRLGEYTVSTEDRRTVPLRKQDKSYGRGMCSSLTTRPGTSGSKLMECL